MRYPVGMDDALRIGRQLSGFAVLIIGLMACKSGGDGSEHKPTGSPTDPVGVCERPAQVCKFKGSQLGVCVNKPKEDHSCQGKSPCFVCVPQH